MLSGSETASVFGGYMEGATIAAKRIATSFWSSGWSKKYSISFEGMYGIYFCEPTGIFIEAKKPLQSKWSGFLVDQRSEIANFGERDLIAINRF